MHELAAASVCDGLMKDAVAMTRPKRHLCVIGDSDTISKYVHIPFPIHAPRNARLPCWSHN